MLRKGGCFKKSTFLKMCYCLLEGHTEEELWTFLES